MSQPYVKPVPALTRLGDFSTDRPTPLMCAKSGVVTRFRLLVLSGVFVAAFAGGCGDSGDENPTAPSVSTTTVAAGASTEAPTATSTLIVDGGVPTVSAASLGPANSDELTLPVQSIDDIVGGLTLRNIWDCPYLAFVVQPGAQIVSPGDGVVDLNFQIPKAFPLTGETGGLGMRLTLASGDFIDMYFGAGSESSVPVGTAVKRGDLLGTHSGTEMKGITLGFNTLMTRSGDRGCVPELDEAKYWVGGWAAVLVP